MTEKKTKAQREAEAREQGFASHNWSKTTTTNSVDGTFRICWNCGIRDNHDFAHKPCPKARRKQ